jgi:hypothetical protein
MSWDFEVIDQTRKKAKEIVEKFDLSRWTYWPIKIEVDDRPDGLHLVVRQRVRDIAGGGTVTAASNHRWVWATAYHLVVENEHLFVELVERAVHDAVRHELQETLWYDGRRLTNPHEGTKYAGPVPGERTD